MKERKIFTMNIKKNFLSFCLVIFIIFSTTQCFAQTNPRISAKQNNRYADILQQLYFYIQQNYVEEVDPELLYEGAIKGMLEALDDPYSSYLDKSAWRSLTDTTDGSFGGVGLSITKATSSTPEKPAYVYVAQPIENSPGEKAGIQSGDYIIEIEGVDTSTITMEEVLGMLRGNVGESVNLKIRRGKNIEFERTLVRAIIQNPTVKYGMIEDTNIGYIRLSEFSSNATDKFQEALDSFAKSSYKSLIIDLRNNGGGLLSTAVNIADKFIDEGLIVETKSRLAYENQKYSAKKSNTVVRNLPVVVLINGASASASEILSGALKDTKKAYLVGEKTYGKGSVQIPSALVNSDGFKITVARYYTPSDVNIDKIGIQPDLEVKFPEFSEENEKALVELTETTEIEDYVELHPNMTENQISLYAKELSKKYNIEERFLRKMIRNEVNKAKPAMLYDLDYDVQLDKAIEILENTKDFSALMQTTKTVKEYNDELEASKNSN